MARAPLAVRPISAEERAVLERAVRVAPAEGVAAPSLEQLDSLQVVGKCQCGCASVDFRHLRSGQIAEVVADAIGDAPNGETVDVLVFALDGEFVGLEIVGYGEAPAPLPIASTVRGWDGRRE
jgi:hypothetical protein